MERHVNLENSKSMYIEERIKDGGYMEAEEEA